MKVRSLVLALTGVIAACGGGSSTTGDEGSGGGAGSSGATDQAGASGTPLSCEDITLRGQGPSAVGKACPEQGRVCSYGAGNFTCAVRCNTGLLWESDGCTCMGCAAGGTSGLGGSAGASGAAGSGGEGGGCEAWPDFDDECEAQNRPPMAYRCVFPDTPPPTCALLAPGDATQYYCCPE